jgi:hypothetical protein
VVSAPAAITSFTSHPKENDTAIGALSFNQSAFTIIEGNGPMSQTATASFNVSRYE